MRVVKFTNPAGVPIAIMFNYAIHSNAETGEPHNMINGDIAHPRFQPANQQLPNSESAPETRKFRTSSCN